ncbi:MAG: DUF882 domain-containing protein [Proteobacteria bacterium]|nr:DUF882 domain-containing protein [Pseudomonadota bacterium]
MTDTDWNVFRAQRRALLRATVGGAIGVAAGPVMAATGPRRTSDHRSLSLRHLHTGETLSVPYLEDGRYSPDALAEIDHLLRDFRTGDKTSMDVGLLDILHRLRTRLESEQPFEILSAYRSPLTNARLAANSRGVAKRSYHLQGMAIDVRLPGRQLRDVRRAALDLRLGGVGYYKRSNFIHLDTGRVRFW